MSLSGNISISILRLIKSGKGSFTDLEKMREKAKKENESFRFTMPKDKKSEYRLLPDTKLPCLIIKPEIVRSMEKAVLYIYGGVTNNWKTQLSMAVKYAAATGVQVWYPVYPSMTEVCVTDTVKYLVGIYERMTEQFSADKVILSGVSMGGFYALQIINLINRERPDIPMPGLLIAHSPGGTPDNEADWNEMRKYEKRDPMFSETDLRTTDKLTPHTDPLPDWALHPAHCDFKNAPPTYLYYGEEMLAGNSTIYKRAFKKSGSGDKLHIEIIKNMMHGYSCMPVFPESKRSYNETLSLIEQL